MTPEEQLGLFAQFSEDQLFTAAMQLMRRIHDDVARGHEEAIHGDLPGAIDDLSLGPWHELDEPLVADWPYALSCLMLRWVLDRLEAVSSEPRAIEAVISARWLLRPPSFTPFWVHG